MSQNMAATDFVPVSGLWGWNTSSSNRFVIENTDPYDQARNKQSRTQG